MTSHSITSGLLHALLFCQPREKMASAAALPPPLLSSSDSQGVSEVIFTTFQVVSGHLMQCAPISFVSFTCLYGVDATPSECHETLFQQNSNHKKTL